MPNPKNAVTNAVLMIKQQCLHCVKMLVLVTFLCITVLIWKTECTEVSRYLKLKPNNRVLMNHSQ